MAEQLLKRSKHDPKVRADRMTNKAGMIAARKLPAATIGFLAHTILKPFGMGIKPSAKLQSRMDRMNAMGREAKAIRSSFSMADTENSVSRDTKRKPPRETKKSRSADKLGNALRKNALNTGLKGMGLVGASGVGAIATGILFGTPASIFTGAASVGAFAKGRKMIADSVANDVAGKMIKRQGANTVRSHRMAETLSMASHNTGVRGPQSEARSGEVAAGFSAANSQFTGKRSTSSAKQPKSDGYVNAHTRARGTKVTQVKKHKRK